MQEEIPSYDIGPSIATAAIHVSNVLKMARKRCSSGRTIWMSTFEAVTSRATMLQGSYKCLVLSGQQDWLKNTRANNDHARDPAIAASCSRSHSQASVDNQTSITPQQQAMKDLVKSLNTVLGDRHPNLMGKLGRMSALSGPDMESVAESMAISALAKTYFSNPEQFVCPYAKSEP
jgi:hypothetical protein